MIRYSLCPGEGLKACMSCRRNVDNNPEAPYTDVLIPARRDDRCADWMAIPKEKK